MRSNFIHSAVLVLWAACLPAQDTAPLPKTAPLTATGDLSAQMVEGIDRWLMRATERVAEERAKRWQSNAGAARQGAFQDLLSIHGLQPPGRSNGRPTNLVFEPASPWPPVAGPAFQFIGAGTNGAEIHREPGAHGFVVRAVRWPVFEGVFGEGLLLEPLAAPGNVRSPAPCAVVIPDADQEPEQLAGLRPGVAPESQFARHLAASGWRVLVPVLVSREDRLSGSERLKKFTNQPHREWIYRQAFEMGVSLLGLEAQKIFSGLTALQAGAGPVAVAGYGEGGLLALHAAALDERIAAVLVSGYFGPRERLWSEPIYRNLFGFSRRLGDAELAAMVAPRQVVVEYAESPAVKGPPPIRNGRSGAAPGAITTPEFSEVEMEAARANQLMAGLPGRPAVELIHGSEGSAVSFGSRKALAVLAKAAGVTNEVHFDTQPRNLRAVADAEVSERQTRTVRELEALIQGLLRRSETAREAWHTFNQSWMATNRPPAREQDRPAWERDVRAKRREPFWQVIGKLAGPRLAPNPRTRQIYDKEKWTGHEVMLDVAPDVMAWGWLLVPKDLKPGEKRPVVVCQHGLEGLPEDTVTEDPKSNGYKYYKAFAARLAERGFIVYAPHNPYRGQDKFRVLQRKANPLGLSLFSFIIAQHEVTTDWLASLPFVDPERIGFYGLSYGGKTAMRVPAVVDRYCLSICSADFNDWIRKCVTTDSPYSYMFTGEYEMPEWNLGRTFNYAEMAGLIAPRPFMVERGHGDGVAPDEWVAYEYAKVRRLYDKLGLGDRTEIEFFDGPHTINGVGTFKFLEKHLKWPSAPRNGAVPQAEAPGTTPGRPAAP